MHIKKGGFGLRKIIVGLMMVGLLVFVAHVQAEVEDGEYWGVSEADSRGYVRAEITISNGEIVDVELTEYRGHGMPKGEDYGFEPWHDAMEELPQMFIEANSAEIDIITGATGTSQKAIDAVEKALARAEGVTEPFDGTFLGISEVSERGAWGVAMVTVEDGEIVDVKLEESTDDGEFKDEEYPYDEFHEAREEMPGWFIEANSPEVDIYTGATGSAERWMEAVEQALIYAGVITEE